ncbi:MULTISPECIES: hypothetical protein [Paraburkholderia]|uniref:Lipoprotein n=1 Tax=Paraburkholderia dioscoreae TaxID=2604047 RepID=A0A5Q4Z7T3_9BURK|nr:MULTISPECIES: hypothetical protein [Paraburkholderia]MDR8397442.1 hypothetical protein [Paraburkholderia sp. USG1]VVD27161.1 conserved exported protein of unknown function [Paraburkholderia dioscoreae]
MTTSLRHTATWMFFAIASCGLPAFAQNAAPNPAAAAPAPAATATNDYGVNAQLPANRRAAHRNSEQALLGAPNPYGTDNMQGNTDDAQRNALLDTQRMTVLGGGQGAQPALGKSQRKAPAAAANGQVRVAGQPGRPNPATLTPEGAATAAYADPYAGKRGVYRSPW